MKHHLPRPASLPEDTVDAEARAASIRESAEEHAWDWSWPPGCATLKELPKSDRYRVDFIAATAKLQVEVTANHMAVGLEGASTAGPPPLPTTPEELSRSFFSAAEAFHQGAPRTRPASEREYARYFAKLPVPPLVTRLEAHPEEADLLFAWQRVAGANPMSLRVAKALPEDFVFTEAQWSANGHPSSLAATLAEGRLFEVDFTVLHGAPATRYLGRQKYLCGTRGLFTSATGPLMPVALQLAPGGAVFTPRDGSAWARARFCFNVADANIHETMEHLGATHMVMEAVGIAARRTLAPEHPVRRLVEAHLVGTFAINNSAKHSLIAPGGVIDQVFAARIDVAASLVRASLDRFVLQERAPALELRARGVEDAERLPEYPYRDDVLPLYDATRSFVQAYVRCWYADDAAVSRDEELRAWVDEVRSPIGGDLRGVRALGTIEDLTTWLSNIVHTAGAQHAAVNFPQYPYFGWGANTAGAGWGPPPTKPEEAGEALAMMPPWDCLQLQADTVYQLSGIHYNRLGDYGTALGPKVSEEVSRFAAALEALEARVEAAEPSRRLSYPFLKPSLVPASINI